MRRCAGRRGAGSCARCGRTWRASSARSSRPSAPRWPPSCRPNCCHSLPSSDGPLRMEWGRAAIILDRGLPLPIQGIPACRMMVAPVHRKYTSARIQTRGPCRTLVPCALPVRDKRQSCGAGCGCLPPLVAWLCWTLLELKWAGGQALPPVPAVHGCYIHLGGGFEHYQGLEVVLPHRRVADRS